MKHDLKFTLKEADHSEKETTVAVDYVLETLGYPAECSFNSTQSFWIFNLEEEEEVECHNIAQNVCDELLQELGIDFGYYIL